MFTHGKVSLRPIERRDLDFLRELHNDPTTLRNLTDTTLVNEIQQEKWFESICASRTSMRLAMLDEGGQIVGCVRLDHYDPRNRSVQVGGDIARDRRGRGYGSAMFAACVAYAFGVLNCRRAYLSVLETNAVAIGMYRRHGFVEEGRLVQAVYREGRYHDYINMYLLAEEKCDD